MQAVHHLRLQAHSAPMLPTSISHSAATTGLVQALTADATRAAWLHSAKPYWLHCGLLPQHQRPRMHVVRHTAYTGGICHVRAQQLQATDSAAGYHGAAGCHWHSQSARAGLRQALLVCLRQPCCCCCCCLSPAAAVIPHGLLARMCHYGCCTATATAAASVGTRRAHGGHMEGTWRAHGGHMEGTWRAHGGHMHSSMHSQPT
jgi:hypothetical protein